MLDILMLDDDLAVTDKGDITLTNSVRQSALIRLRWFSGEWRLGPSFGVPYYEDVLIKNPNIDKIRRTLSNELFDIEEVEDVRDMTVTVKAQERQANVKFLLECGEEAIAEEVELLG